MGFEIEFAGNLTADPEMRKFDSGAIVVNFTVAHTPRKFNRDTNSWENDDKNTTFMNCEMWGNEKNPYEVENVMASLRRGKRVIGVGEVRSDKYVEKDTNKNRVAFKIRVTEVGPSLKFNKVSIIDNGSRSENPVVNVDPFASDSNAGSNFGANNSSQSTSYDEQPSAASQEPPF